MSTICARGRVACITGGKLCRAGANTKRFNSKDVLPRESFYAWYVQETLFWSLTFGLGEQEECVGVFVRKRNLLKSVFHAYQNIVTIVWIWTSDSFLFLVYTARREDWSVPHASGMDVPRQSYSVRDKGNSLR